MKVTFLGTGTSQGVPMIACDCTVCTSADERDKRLRTSAWIETPQASIVIDSGPDFRQQMLRAHVHQLDAIIFTHGHKDHISGMDDIRPYNFFNKKVIDVYATPETQESLRREFYYVFDNAAYPGVPQINLHTIEPDRPFSINGLIITPIRVLHYKMEVLGFRIDDFTYITDANHIPAGEMKKIKGSEVLVLNALRHEAHISHYTLSEAINVAHETGATHTYFTHISHQLGRYHDVATTLPHNMHLAYDGLTLDL